MPNLRSESALMNFLDSRPDGTYTVNGHSLKYVMRDDANENDYWIDGQKVPTWAEVVRTLMGGSKSAADTRRVRADKLQRGDVIRGLDGGPKTVSEVSVGDKLRGVNIVTITFTDGTTTQYAASNTYTVERKSMAGQFRVKSRSKGSYFGSYASRKSAEVDAEMANENGRHGLEDWEVEDKPEKAAPPPHGAEADNILKDGELDVDGEEDPTPEQIDMALKTLRKALVKGVRRR